MTDRSDNSTARPEARVIYCHCAYSKVVPAEVKDQVLRALCDAGRPFEMVADLCEMSAKGDASLKAIASNGGGAVKIAACYPRAVRWLFHAAGAPLPAEGVEVLNMREHSAEQVVQCLLHGRPIEAAAEQPTDQPVEETAG